MNDWNIKKILIVYISKTRIPSKELLTKNHVILFLALFCACFILSVCST